MKFSFIRKTSLQVQDIWKDGEFSKWALSPLDQKSFQEVVFKAFKDILLSLIFTSGNYSKTIIRLRFNEHRWIFNNVHYAFGEFTELNLTRAVIGWFMVRWQLLNLKIDSWTKFSTQNSKAQVSQCWKCPVNKYMSFSVLRQALWMRIKHSLSTLESI